MGIIKRILGLEPSMVELISVKVCVSDKNEYHVVFYNLHPELKQYEYIRLFSHYYSKMLFNLAGDMGASMLNQMIYFLLVKGLNKKSDVLKDADIDDVVRLSRFPPSKSTRDYGATLYFIDTVNRQIKTSIPSNGFVQEAVFSVFALLQEIINGLDEGNIFFLERTIRAMYEKYESGQSYADIRNLSLIPTTAYMSALFGEEAKGSSSLLAENNLFEDPNKEWNCIEEAQENADLEEECDLEELFKEKNTNDYGDVEISF